MRRIGLVARVDRPDAPAVARELTGWLVARGLEVVTDRDTAGLCPEGVTAVERSQLPGCVDLIVVLGGDGTLLSVARLVGGREVPILGVNLGGEYAVEDRMVLQAGLSRSGETLAEYQALNDVVIAKGALGRLIDLEVAIDGQMVTAYRADGLIIATPTGSTAYNLSAGGPILFPTMDAVVLTPICSHAPTNRPIVLAATARLEVTLLTDTPDVALSVDGHPGLPVTRKDVVRVGPAKSRIRLIRDAQKTYFQVLRTKLKWGER
jgi:NAD+ kinase